MWPQPKDFHVDVHAYVDKSAKSEVRFELPGADGATPPRIRFDKHDEQMRGVDWHRVIFTLHNHDGLQLRFHDEKKQAVWARTATDAKDCPTSYCRHKDFKPIWREDLRLEVRNNNYKPEEIAFTLNFLRPGDDGEDPGTFVICDPIGGNENRGTPLTHQQFVGALVGTASIATVGAALLARKLFKRSPAKSQKPNPKRKRTS